jgi:hypothetical protein
MISADLTDPSTYQYLTLIIDEFEKAALKSQTREGTLIVMHSPLDSLDQVLGGSSKTLTKVSETRGAHRRRSRAASDPTTTNTASTGSGSSGEVCPEDIQGNGYTISTEPLDIQAKEQQSTGVIPAPPTVKGSGGVKLDVDLAELFGGGDTPKADAIKAYMKDCVGCDTRVSFNWQMPAFDLLGPIADMVKEINASLDKLEKLTDPTALLANFCKNMNEFQLICIPDWTMILMSLKMLLRKYLNFNLNIKLDWTVILGPLLSVIVDGIAALIQQVAGVVFSPIDCAIAALKTMEKFEHELKDTVNTAKEVGKGAAQYAKEVSKGQFLPNAETKSLTRDETAQNGKLGSEQRDSKDAQNKNAWTSIWAGVEIESQRNLASEVKKDNSSLVGMITSAVEEAREYIDDLVDKILATLKSVKGLVGGGLNIQLQALGFLTMVIQLVRVVMMIIHLLMSGIKPADWCSYLEEHPEVFEDALKKAVDRKSSVKKGQVTVGGRTTELKTCISSRTSVDEGILNQWIADLRRGV